MTNFRLIRTIAHTCIIFLACINVSQAQTTEPRLTGGNSLAYFIPKGDFATTYNHGFGFYGHVDYKLINLLSLRADVGWANISGNETEYVDTDGVIQTNHPHITVWEITGGARINLSVFYLEGRAGYFSGLNSFGYVPAVGLRLGKLDIQGNWAFVGDDQFIGIRAGYYWSEN